MHHIHLPATPSTQDEVKKALKLGKGPFLVSTDHQTAGFGRQGSQWHQFNDALAFSFTLKPNPKLTLTPLEIGILLAQFFGSNVALKWPNDLLNNNFEKLGGILCQLVGEVVVVGIGLNLRVPQDHQEFPYPIAGILQSNSEIKDEIKRSLPLEIVNYILSHRLSTDEVKSQFMNHCVHQKSEVTISNNKESDTGVFIGISEDGAAILKDKEGHEKTILSGSLIFKKD